ncbi:GMC family oxidoreductase [Nocardia mexicana]|uniref:GMC family oxidoreductase n=1 Tax=Nocardia mexicana TaxID=279262 RepID=UPI00082CD119|nr:GMC family oxidoreductase N-terminal domain-containing protein [Nocardia mexicana]
MTEFDYVIVGAGPAGCVLAHRLSADPETTVLLVEAGGRDTSPLIGMPMGFGKLLGDPRHTWQYPIRPIGPGDRAETWVRGKTLGGSSAVNGMIYNRGQRADWDELERRGNPGWGWDTMLPIFRAIEDNPSGASDLSGSGGPLRISTTSGLDPFLEEILDTGAALGWKQVRDINAEDTERIGYAMATIRNGRRCSAATAFLHPVERRANLTVAVRTVADRVLIERGTAVGIRCRRKGRGVDYRARREVLLCCGALATPKILQLSGIGPAETLRSAGVAVLADSPNVGARLIEHHCFVLQYRLVGDLGYNRLLGTPAGQLRSGIRYLATRGGPLAGPGHDIVGFFQSRPGLDRPDAQIQIGPWSIAPQLPGEPVTLEREPGIMCIGYLLRPDSTGSLRITGPDPDAALDIDANYFATDHDRRVAVDTFRTMRRLFATEPLASRLGPETTPGPHVDTDAEIIDACLDGGVCGYHAIGTAAMGPDADDVVDPQLRVRGVAALRVVDVSVLPTMVSGNLNGPVTALAWRAADLITGASDNAE